MASKAKAREALNNCWKKAAATTRHIRKGTILGNLSYLEDLWAALLRLWELQGIDIKEAVWGKYPGVCPYCLASEDCDCINLAVKLQIDKKALRQFRLNVANKPETIRGYQTMLDRIYGKTNRAKSIADLWFHVIEELGEMAEEFDAGNMKRFKDESADVFSWFVDVCNYLEVDMDSKQLD